MEISKVSKRKAGKTTTSFGNSKRFDNGSAAVTAHAIVGPGTYNVGFKFGKQSKSKKAASIKEEGRCPSIINKNVKVPGPGSY